MRKSKLIMVALLAVIMLIGMTACGYPEAHPDVQRQKAEEYITKYLNGHIESEAFGMSNRCAVFTVHSTYGFDYAVGTMEVPISDLGFTADETVESDTVFIENSYFENYIFYLLSNMDTSQINDLTTQYQDTGFHVVCNSYDSTLFTLPSGKTYETAIHINNLGDKTPIFKFVEILKAEDEDNQLESYVMPIYFEDSDDKCDAYYDFYLNYIFTKEEYEAACLLHDYLLNAGIKPAAVLSVQDDYPTSSVNDQTFKFVHENDNGVYILFAVNGETWEFHSSPGVFQEETLQDDFGVRQGSLLDLVLSERDGNKPLQIAIFAIYYPDNYQSLALYCQPIVGKEASDND